MYLNCMLWFRWSWNVWDDITQFCHGIICNAKVVILALFVTIRFETKLVLWLKNYPAYLKHKFCCHIVLFSSFANIWLHSVCRCFLWNAFELRICVVPTVTHHASNTCTHTKPNKHKLTNQKQTKKNKNKETM